MRNGVSKLKTCISDLVVENSIWLFLLFFVVVTMFCIVTGGYRFGQDRKVKEIYGHAMREDGTCGLANNIVHRSK